MWQYREAADGWWEVYSSADETFVYCRCPRWGHAWLIANMMNGGIQFHKMNGG